MKRIFYALNTVLSLGLFLGLSNAASAQNISSCSLDSNRTVSIQTANGVEVYGYDAIAVAFDSLDNVYVLSSLPENTVWSRPWGGSWNPDNSDAALGYFQFTNCYVDSQGYVIVQVNGYDTYAFGVAATAVSCSSNSVTVTSMDGSTWVRSLGQGDWSKVQ